MPTPILPIRRLVLAPLIVVFELGLVLASPLILLASVVASPLFGGWRPVRMAVIVLAVALHHLAACAACARLWLGGVSGRHAAGGPPRHAHYGVLRSLVNGIYRAVERAARVEVVLAAGSTEAEQVLSSPGPVVVLSRHSGEGDTLLVLHQLACRHDRLPRVVMHERLRLDPVIDVLGRRLPNRFVDPRGGDTEGEIAALARDMDERAALLIFPEGGNSTASRRRRGVERLEQAGHRQEADWARGMRYLSAPRPGGALAAIEAAPPGSLVVFVGHVGLPCSLSDAWRLLADPQTVEVKQWAVPAEEVPADQEAAIDWLFGWWQTIDAWVSERHEARAAGDGAS